MMTEEEKKAKNREKMRRWRAANPERMREMGRESCRRQRAADPERMKEKQRRWRAANLERARELGRESSRRRRGANPELARELCRESNRRWRAANPERARDLNRKHSRTKNHNRRARLHGAIDPCQPVTSAILSRRDMLFGSVCCFCGTGGKLTLEHVVALSRGGLHVPSNLAPSCKRCNSSKHADPVELWYPRQPFFDPERWEFLQANTGNRWAAAVQPSLAISLPPPAPMAAPSSTLRRLSPAAAGPARPAELLPIPDDAELEQLQLPWLPAQ